MLNLKPSGQFEKQTQTFLEQNPAISESLIAELDGNISQVSTLIGPIMEAPKRCELSHYYIQAIVTGEKAFLTTNLPDISSTHVTEVATSWLIGRSSNCAISILDRSVSRCHAVIGRCPNRGFYLMDLGSSNGTFVNRSRLGSLEQRPLYDGDLLEFHKFRVEFFISGQRKASASEDTSILIRKKVGELET